MEIVHWRVCLFLSGVFRHGAEKIHVSAVAADSIGGIAVKWNTKRSIKAINSALYSKDGVIAVRERSDAFV